MVCRAGGRLCAVPVERVVETMRPLPIEPVRSAPPFVLGVAIIRGAAVPVVDTARLLAAPPVPPGRFVTVRAGDRVVALAVDQVIGVVAIPSLAGLPSLIGTASADAVAHIAAHDAELLAVLEASLLVPDTWWDARGAEAGAA